MALFILRIFDKNVLLRIFLLIIAICSVQLITAQDDFLAKQYFNDGDFEKAVVFYEKLVEKNPRRTDYSEGLVACYQQLERYGEAEKFLLKKINEGNTYPILLIELGYNHALQDAPEKAIEYYEDALKKIDENPNYGYSIAFRFQKYSLLNYALRAYSRAMELNPKLDYNYQIARIYGEQGDIEKMYGSYMNLLVNGKTSKSNVLRSIEDFISSDPENENNVKLKRILLKNAQKNPDILWNELLSWLFVQQKQYGNAFRQEKAIFKRMEGGTIQRLVGLGDLALDDSELEVAQSIFEYVVEKSADKVTKLNAQLNLIDIKLMGPNEKMLDEIQKQFETLVEILSLFS